MKCRTLTSYISDFVNQSTEKFLKTHNSSVLVIPGSCEGQSPSASSALLHPGIADVYALEENYEGGLLTIGRSAHNDISIGDQTVSRNHAFLRHYDGDWELQRREGSNLLLVKRLGIKDTLDGTGWYPLNSGDEIQFGKVNIQYFNPADIHRYIHMVQRVSERE